MLRIRTAGNPQNIRSAVVGIVSRTPLPEIERADHILVAREVSPDLAGYSAVLTSEEPQDCTTPVIFAPREIDHLSDGDIIVIEPNGFVRTLYRPASPHNIIFATEQCNHRCLMCSQPPKERDDRAALTQRNLKLISLLQQAPCQLTITGGEPTLLGEGLIGILKSLRDKFPATHVHILTNGRAFASPTFTSKIADLNHPDLCIGIPLYSDDAATHDYVVQARGAFAETIAGFHQLARYGMRSEVRVVLHRITIPRLSELAEYIYRNLTFVEHVALMVMEHVGFATQNMAQLWIDPYDYQENLEEAVEFLSARMMNVSIYNHPLCLLRPSLWKFAKKSISDWKNIYVAECENCKIQDQCAGFFQWETKFKSSHIHAFTDRCVSATL